MTRIALNMADGQIAIMNFSADLEVLAKEFPERLDTFVGAEISKWLDVNPGKVVLSWRTMVNSEDLSDRTFRAAWRHVDGKSIVIDMPAARNIWRDRMRQARQPLLEALDVETIKLVEQGKVSPGDMDTLFKKKQALRDVTAMPEIEAAQTPDELRNVWPVILGDKK